MSESHRTSEQEAYEAECNKLSAEYDRHTRPVQTEVCPVCRTVHDKPLCSVDLTRIRDASLTWAMACNCECAACSAFYDVVRGQPAPETPDVHSVPWTKPIAEWPDIAAAIHAAYDAPPEGHKGCAAMALAAASEIERLRGSEKTSVRPVSASDRLHRICDALSEQADQSPFTREEWERIDKETVRLQNCLRHLAQYVAFNGDTWVRDTALAYLRGAEPPSPPDVSGES